MVSDDLLIENLDFLVKRSNIKVKSLEREMGIRLGKIADATRRKATLNAFELDAIAKKLKYSMHDLLNINIEEMERIKAASGEMIAEEPYISYASIKVSDLYEIDIKTLPPRVQFYVNQLRTQIYQTYKRLEDKEQTIEAKNETIKSLNKIIEVLEDSKKGS